MTWLTWRLHRTEAAIGSALLAGLLLLMLAGVRSITAAYDAARIGGCFGDTNLASTPQGCQMLLNNYWIKASTWGRLTVLLYAVPLGLTVLLAIPTLQELERGTFRLVWTQSITRTAWAINRGLFVIGVALLVAAIWAPAARWWYDAFHRDAPSHELNRFAQPYFDFSPPVLVGYSLFALALALALTVVLRRLAPVLALTAVGFVATRYVVFNRLRPRFRSPVEQTFATNNPGIPATPSGADWVLDQWWVTSSGERISDARFYSELCQFQGSGSPDDFFARCIAGHGLRRVVAYQPADRFWQFQAIETAIFIGLAILLFAVAFWWLRRRIT
jgi:hypothetical protein